MINEKDFVYSSKLDDLFGSDITEMEKYIKPGRKFWNFDSMGNWCPLTVTYVRSGVIFYVYDDDKEHEIAWYVSSFGTSQLYAETIYVDELATYYKKKYEHTTYGYFYDLLKNCKWQDFNGAIKISVKI